MAFIGKTAGQSAHDAAVVCKDRQIVEHAARFKGMAHNIARDANLRREHSIEHRVVVLGESAVAALSGRVRDFDGSDRQASMRIDLQFLDDGSRIDQENMHLARRVSFWSSLAEGDRHNASGRDAGGHDFDRMRVGALVSMLGRTVVTPASEFQKERRDFQATQILVGDHSADKLMSSMRCDLGAAAERYVAARTYLEQEAIALGYARRLVEAMGPSVEVNASLAAPVRAKGPAMQDYRADFIVAKAAGAGR